MISLQGLSKKYGRQRGIENVNLEIWSGEIFGYLGPNGAGKTTTIRLILDLIRPDSGSIRIFSMEPRRHSVAIRRRLGYLPGELHLYENMTVMQFLDFCLRLRRDGDRNHANQLAERFSCPWKQRIRNLSQGNKQKVGLIQALMNRPELVILDEPTVGLDPLIRHELYAVLDEARKNGQTIFLSSHNLAEVERICDRVGIIGNGRIVAVEKVSELQERSLRNVEIRFVDPFSPDLVSRLPQVRTVEKVNDRVLKCQVQGDINPLIRELGHHRVADFICQYPSLEEIFLTYYEKESHDDSNDSDKKNDP